jgi:hypothetical protein
LHVLDKLAVVAARIDGDADDGDSKQMAWALRSKLSKGATENGMWIFHDMPRPVGPILSP